MLKFVTFCGESRLGAEKDKHATKRKFVSAVKHYHTIYKFKTIHSKSKNWECPILLLEEIIGKLIKS